MAQITAGLVKELREKTGAGMMDCKKALSESEGDLEAAVDWLRKKGLSKAAKKAGRVAADGLIGVAVRDGAGAVVEVNSETDFVARNASFQGFVREVADLALDVDGDAEQLAAATAASSGKTVGDTLTDLIATIGENMTLRRAGALTAKPGVVAAYVHAPVSEGLGRIGVLAALESEGDAAALTELGRKICMHIAATAPAAARIEDLDPALVERERGVLSEQARASGKPEEVIAKMVEGRLRKFYEESVLLEQVFVVDGESKVKDVIKKAEADIGALVTLTGYVRMALGEGLEKKEEDFAAEVAAAAAAKA